MEGNPPGPPTPQTGVAAGRTYHPAATPDHDTGNEDSMSQPAHLPHRFALHRRYDLTGISGTGLVAYGTQYPSGRVTLAWCCSDIQSIAVYDTIDDIERIHGHGGLTEIRWIDPPNPADTTRHDPTPTALPSEHTRCATAKQTA